MVSVHASGPSSQGFNSRLSQKNSETKLPILRRFIDGAAAYSSGHQGLNNDDKNHLVLSSGKIVLQKFSLNARALLLNLVRYPFSLEIMRFQLQR